MDILKNIPEEPEQAEMLGEELAKALLAQGAGELLKALYQ